MRSTINTIALFFVAMLVDPASAQDWPNFRGPKHDGIVSASGLRLNWAESKPKEVWKRTIGAGFSSFAVSNGRVFTAGTEKKQQTLVCLDEKSGAVIWQIHVEAEMTDPDPNLHGPRSTPTVDQDRVYFLGALGRLVCLKVETGDVVWEKQFRHMPHWGYAGSVLIDGDLAIVSPGVSDGAILAMDKRTGAVGWKCGDEESGYATPYPFELEGRRYICAFMAKSFIVADRATGRKVLAVDWPSHSGVNVAGPIFHDGRLLMSTGYGFGAGLFKLRRDGDGLAAEEIWKTTKLRNKFQTPLLIDGRLYTSDETGLKCVEFATGVVVWQKRGIVHSPLIAAGKQLLLLRETGELQTGRASTDGFSVESEIHLFEGSTRSMMQQITRQRQGKRCWTTPVLANGRLFARDHDTVICLDVSATQASPSP